MYRCTVRGETRIPSFKSSSDAIRSSPQVRFAVAISPTPVWTISATGSSMVQHEEFESNTWANRFRHSHS